MTKILNNAKAELKNEGCLHKKKCNRQDVTYLLNIFDPRASLIFCFLDRGRNTSKDNIQMCEG